MNQKHTNQVIYFKNKADIQNKMVGDAIVSTIENIAIAVLTADCAPILLYDPNKKIIGCIHSGWKGALNGIIKNTIKKFDELNSNRNDIIAVIGPCIKNENYEVENDFLKKFTSKNKKMKFFLKKKVSKNIFLI